MSTSLTLAGTDMSQKIEPSMDFFFFHHEQLTGLICPRDVHRVYHATPFPRKTLSQPEEWYR